jgi:hypothetical protein
LKTGFEEVTPTWRDSQLGKYLDLIRGAIDEEGALSVPAPT